MLSNLIIAFKDSYGSGKGLGFKRTMVAIAVVLVLGVIGIFSIYFVSRNIPNMPIRENKFLLLYIGTVFMSVAISLMSAHYFVKIPPTKDRFKYIKYTTYALSLIILCVLLLPVALLLSIVWCIGKKMKISLILADIPILLMTIAVWLILFMNVTPIFLFVGDLVELYLRVNEISLHQFLTIRTIFHYGMLLSLLVCNFVSRFLFSKLSRIKDVVEKDELATQLSRSWNYIVLAISIFLMPIEFYGDAEIWAEATLYSIAIITIITEIRNANK